MGWVLTGRPTTAKASAKLAKEFVDMAAVHVDRPLSERRLGVYRKVRQEGGFRPVTWAKAWCEETREVYRVNGKHTATLFSDGQLLDNIYITVEEYKCDTLEDVAKLYGTFDSQTQTRNATEINLSFASVVPGMQGFDSKFINLAVGTLNYIPTRVAGVNNDKTAAERAEVLFDNVSEVLWLRSILSNQKLSKHMFRVPVAAAMLGSYRKSQSAATTFWTAVRDETGITPQLPDRKLAKFLITSVSDQGAHKGSGRYRAQPREYYVKSVLAWNAWRKNVTTELKYFTNAKIPAFA